jgi:hypothetical protein
MAVGNKLGLTDDDFDGRVYVASADAASGTAAAAAAGGGGGGGDVDATSVHGVTSMTTDVTYYTDDDKRQTEALLRAQIEMDLQRTMPRCF